MTDTARTRTAQDDGADGHQLSVRPGVRSDRWPPHLAPLARAGQCTADDNQRRTPGGRVVDGLVGGLGDGLGMDWRTDWWMDWKMDWRMDWKTDQKMKQRPE